MSSVISTPNPLPMGPEVTKKPNNLTATPSARHAAAAAVANKQQQQQPLNAAGDKANLVEFWRRPEAGNIYRHAEHLTLPVTPCLVEHAQLCQAVSAAKAPLKVMDMACGTGVVSSYIQKMMRELPPHEREKLKLTSADSSEAQLGVVKDKMAREKWVGCEVKQTDIMVNSFLLL
ncbi:methyltransferase tpcH [Colletotrichum spaethianum]|uniref:Methyltransferase tpcH n=1 Tax=Colletotrichum spaethianum TaxID=700344 RepID=A0AA37PAL1_9PEZI|nr:methyltransferase tpcH [Colletotrichum spaethianum]GKT48699.1 methyltransferase tpcH [Colletotrichum spaethianum]